MSLNLLGHSINGQSIPEIFKQKTDSLVKTNAGTYESINSVLRSYRRDTTLMKYFIEEASKNNHVSAQAYALNQLGIKYRNISNFKKAIEMHQKALEISKDGDNKEFHIFSLNMLGVVYRRSDAVKTALDYNQEALELAESIENPSQGIRRSINVSLNGIGNIYQLLEQYDLAIKKFEESLKLEKELGNIQGLAINHQNIGECLEAEEKLEEALTSFRTSLAYNEQVNSVRGLIFCKYSIAHVYVHQGKTKEALEILEPLLTDAENLSDKSILSSVEINLGWAYMEAKEINKANTHLLRALEIAETYNLPDAKAESNKFISSLLENKGDYETAMAYYKKAKGIEKQISNSLNRRYANDVIMKYDAEKKNTEIELLHQENEIVRLKLRRNRTTLLISSLGLALLAGILYILYRQYQLKNEKKVLTLEQSMLRSQMNPHFLFNSLNSIKLYIINNEKKNAVHYLNKFSKLVRKILEASSLKEISLADELETVELYMNIENIRFSNEINFEIKIADDIDIHTVKMPSLILQPFLENAIWHGLSSKEGNKNITLEVTKENNWFTNITITDNGVGRGIAEKIKKSKVLKRKSVGIDITKERLANFSKDYQNSFDVEIIDLFNDSKRPIGTKVVLHIPTI